MKTIFAIGILFWSMTFLGCAGQESKLSASNTKPPTIHDAEMADMTIYDETTPIADVISDPVFEDYGRLIFPADDGYYSGTTLGELRLTWYNNIRLEKMIRPPMPAWEKMTVSQAGARCRAVSRP